jgi:hypothetical protein
VGIFTHRAMVLIGIKEGIEIADSKARLGWAMF